MCIYSRFLFVSFLSAHFCCLGAQVISQNEIEILEKKFKIVGCNDGLLLLNLVNNNRIRLTPDGVFCDVILLNQHSLDHFPIAITPLNWGDDIGIFYNAVVNPRIYEIEIQASEYMTIPIMNHAYEKKSGGKFSTEYPVLLIEKDLSLKNDKIYLTDSFIMAQSN